MAQWAPLGDEDDFLRVLARFARKYGIVKEQVFHPGHFPLLNRILDSRDRYKMVQVGDYLVIVEDDDTVVRVFEEVQVIARELGSGEAGYILDFEEVATRSREILSYLYETANPRRRRSLLDTGGVVVGVDVDSSTIFVHRLPRAAASLLAQCESPSLEDVRAAMGFDYDYLEDGLVVGGRVRVQGDVVLEVEASLKDEDLAREVASRIARLEEALWVFLNAWYDGLRVSRRVLEDYWSRMQGIGRLIEELLHEIERWVDEYRGGSYADADMFIAALAEGYLVERQPNPLVQALRIYDVRFSSLTPWPHMLMEGAVEGPQSLRGVTSLLVEEASRGSRLRESRLLQVLAGILLAAQDFAGRRGAKVTLQDEHNIFHFWLDGLLLPVAYAMGVVAGESVEGFEGPSPVVVRVGNHELSFEGYLVRAPLLSELDHIMRAHYYAGELARAESLCEGIDPFLRLLLSRVTQHYIIPVGDIIARHREHGEVRIRLEEPVLARVTALHYSTLRHQ